uniref:Uncharacterized protein n=1 Tax=Spumella elongata TaxID=89044 RepID=A0A7S3HSH5_9STRA
MEIYHPSNILETSSFGREESEICRHDQSQQTPFLDLRFSKRLLVLEKKGMEIQYQLAYLSTLGGAYHLCNRPETAFYIALRQEMIGRLLGSHSIVIRAKVFQAVNLSLLGYPKASKNLFKACKRVAAANDWAGMTAFVTASEHWLRGQKALEGGNVSGFVGLSEGNNTEHAHVCERIEGSS